MSSPLFLPRRRVFEFHSCSELLRESVVELLHGDLSVLVVIEFSHQDVLFVVRHVDVQPV